MLRSHLGHPRSDDSAHEAPLSAKSYTSNDLGKREEGKVISVLSSSDLRCYGEVHTFMRFLAAGHVAVPAIADT